VRNEEKTDLIEVLKSLTDYTFPNAPRFSDPFAPRFTQTGSKPDDRPVGYRYASLLAASFRTPR
jgi:hypothetical protein